MKQSKYSQTFPSPEPHSPDDIVLMFRLKEEMDIEIMNNFQRRNLSLCRLPGEKSSTTTAIGAQRTVEPHFHASARMSKGQRYPGLLGKWL
jgi:hypothetical protein